MHLSQVKEIELMITKALTKNPGQDSFSVWGRSCHRGTSGRVHQIKPPWTPHDAPDQVHWVKPPRTIQGVSGQATMDTTGCVGSSHHGHHTAHQIKCFGSSHHGKHGVCRVKRPLISSASEIRAARGKAWVPAMHTGDLDEAQALHFGLPQSVAVEAIWKVNQQMEKSFFLSLD